MTIYAENICNHSEIFKTINALRDKYTSNNKLALIIFDENISFIQPFFLILLLQFKKEKENKDKYLIIDTINLSERIEGYILTFFTQQIQFEEVKFPNVTIEKDKYNFDYYHRLFSGTRSDMPCIYWYALSKNKTTPLTHNFCTDKYTFLPILKLTNETTKSIHFSDDRKEIIYEKCSEFYQNVSVDFHKTNIEYEANLKLSIGQLVNGIKRPEELSELIEDDEKKLQVFNQKLSNIFFELFDNIKRHTKDKENYANAYLSCDNNAHKDQYEYIISDDYQIGFIQSFASTLKKNKDSIPKKLLDQDGILEKSYLDAISKIKSNTKEDDQEILNGLFGIKDVIALREIQRVTMHFGIPMLLKLLQDVEGTLEMYVHHNNDYYHISYNGSSESAPNIDILKDVDNEEMEGRKGTHIHLTFPKSGLLNYLSKNTEINTKQALNIKNETLKNIFLDRDNIQNKIDVFKYVSLIDLDTKLFSNTIEKQIIICFSIPTFNGTISDFIRAIFSYALFHNTLDIYIYNFPIDIYKEYISIIIKTLYKESTKTKIHIPNIIFQNNNSFDITFVGGDTFEELLSINKQIALEYNSGKESIFGSIVEDIEAKIHRNSKLFFKLNKKYMILPFVLIKNKYLDENILGLIIVNIPPQ